MKLTNLKIIVPRLAHLYGAFSSERNIFCNRSHCSYLNMEPSATGGGRRKRKSFLIKARKYGKMGRFGRGSHINEETYQYFIRIMELSRSDFDTDEERRLFVDNVFEQTIGEEVNYSCNQLASRALENLLPFVSDGGLKRFMIEFDGQIRQICSDQFASHVLQKLLATAAQRGSKPQDDDDFAHMCNEWVLKIGKYALNNLEELVWDQCANHVMRTALECLSSSEISSHQNAVTDFGKHLISWPQLTDMGFNNLTSGLLQSAIGSLAKVDAKLARKLGRILLSSCFQPIEGQESAMNLFTDSSTHLLDAVICVASPKLFTQIYEQFFKNKLKELACNRHSNFCVQRLLEHCPDKETLAILFAELSEHFEDILKSGHTGVILAVGNACQRLSTLQSSFLQSVFKALGCWEPGERQLHATALIAGFSHFNSEQVTISKVHLHGSLLLQTILNFNKPIKIVNSLLEMDEFNLKTLFCDTKGCHIMDAFVTSQYVGEKSREKLAYKVKGMCVDLACTKHGSRALDSLWDSLPLKLRTMLAEELAPKETILNSNQFGRILVNRYGLTLFRHKRSEWQDYQAKEHKKRKLFADIISKTEH